jgi:hypothetical protein
MSNRESNNDFEELFRFAVIGQYLGLTSQVVYNRKSWSVVHKSLEQIRLQQKRNQMLQTIAIIAVTLSLSVFIFFDRL